MLTGTYDDYRSMGRLERHSGSLYKLLDTTGAAPVIVKNLGGKDRGWSSAWGRNDRHSALFKGPREYQDDDFRLKHMHDDEARFMAQLLMEPSRNPAQILHRQAVIGDLSQAPNLKELINLKNRSYRSYTGAWDFLCYYGFNPNYWKSNEERLVRAFHQGETKYPDYDDSGFGIHGWLPIRPVIEEALGK